MLVSELFNLFFSVVLLYITAMQIIAFISYLAVASAATDVITVSFFHISWLVPK